MKQTKHIAALLVVLSGLTSCLHALERKELQWDEIVAIASSLREEPFRPTEGTLPPPYAALGYDEYRRIRFLEENTLWGNEGLPFQVQFFHRGYLFHEKISVHEFSRTHVQEIPFQRSFFDYDRQDLPPLRGPAAAFAGLRINAPLNQPDKYDEVISFLGASYFRALGQGNVYGVSARGLAINLGRDLPEEFPAFRSFWLGKPLGNSPSILLYALLDSPSVTGAYRFTLTPGDATRLEVDAVLFARGEEVTFGLAPLTSMFWYGEHTHPRPDDYRPEVHDSDGLYLRLADGTELWRPLTAPTHAQTTRHPADNPSAFGLLQRDRAFANYLDTEAAYHRRPSVLVVPRGDWGPGTLTLLELPPRGEFADNIALCWIPAHPPTPGEPYKFSYTLLWGDLPSASSLARIGETRRGRELRRPEQTRFMIDFHLPDGVDTWPDNLELRTEATTPETLLSAELQHIPETPRVLRASLLIDTPANPPARNDMRATLHYDGRIFSETWSFPWTP